MSIIFSQNCLTLSGDGVTDLAKYAASAYGFVLNTPENRNRSFSGSQFADEIAKVFDEPMASLVCEELRKLP